MAKVSWWIMEILKSIITHGRRTAVTWPMNSSSRTCSPKYTSGILKVKNFMKRRNLPTMPVPGVGPGPENISPIFSARYINPYLDRSEARFIVNDATLPCVLALQKEDPAAICSTRGHGSGKIERQRRGEKEER